MLNAIYIFELDETALFIFRQNQEWFWSAGAVFSDDSFETFQDAYNDFEEFTSAEMFYYGD